MSAVIQLILHQKHLDRTEAVVWGCSVEKVFLEISQNLQENTCVRVSFLIKLQASKRDTCFPVSCEISKNSFPYRTLLVVASHHSQSSPSTTIISKYFLVDLKS